MHSPDLKEGNIILQSIQEWEAGTSSKAMISCKAQFKNIPKHSEYISEIDNDIEILRCSGWRKPISISFITKPPFLIFDISSLFTTEITDLKSIPKDIHIYGDHYRLGGATSHVSSRSHYIGYICLNHDKLLFFDGLPSTNPVLRAYTQYVVYGRISLLIYFPYENNANDCNSAKKMDSMEFFQKPTSSTSTDTSMSTPISIAGEKKGPLSKKKDKVPNFSNRHLRGANKPPKPYGLRSKPVKKRLSANWVKFCNELNNKVSDSSDEDFYFLHANDISGNSS